MENLNLPIQISYTLLVHAGSYKDFLKKFTDKFPNMEIKEVKQKAVHYYIVHIRETDDATYSKKDIYDLPIMAMREEFSNYLFFKSVKGYNNVLRIMFKDREKTQVPYLLYQEMLTPLEKYRYAGITEKTDSIKYSKISEQGTETEITILHGGIFTPSVLGDMFSIEALQVEGQDKVFADLIKKQELRIGIL